MEQWYYNIKMYLEEIWYFDVDWIDVVQDGLNWRDLVNTVMKLPVL
jgi:hypothetical protein